MKLDETILPRNQSIDLEEVSNREAISNSCNTPPQRNFKKRLSWTSDEKELVLRKANFYIENCETPTMKFCEYMIEKYPQLKHRSPVTVKAFIHNTITKRKREIMNPNTKTRKRGMLLFVF